MFPIVIYLEFSKNPKAEIFLLNYFMREATRAERTQGSSLGRWGHSGLAVYLHLLVLGYPAPGGLQRECDLAQE
jgi:hypothetical protein